VPERLPSGQARRIGSGHENAVPGRSARRPKGS